ncbi:MAG TPA: HEAT repeat domain-containing protein [Candidatus Polarisedimenticolaceae bacterium]
MTLVLVLWAIAAVASLVTGFTLLIVVNKIQRELREAWRRARRRELEPAVLAYAHGKDAALLPALGGRLRLRDRRVVAETLIDFIQRVRGIERDRLGEALDHLGYVDRWLAGLSSRRWWKRADCAEKLGLAVARRAAPELPRLLRDDVAEVRLRAAKALGAVGGHAAVSPLVHALADASRWSTIRVADILASMGPTVTAELAHAFPGLPVAAKLAALDVVGRIKSPDSVPWLVQRLRDPERDVRARAAHAIGEIGDPAAGRSLAALLRDPEWPVRAMAAKAIGRLRHADAASALCDSLRDREWWVRANAGDALRRLGDRGVEALERMLDDADVFARHQAVIQLQESGRLDAIVEGLADADAARRDAAAVYVGKFVRAGQIGRLRELALHHADARVRAALKAMLPAGALEPGRVA